MAIIVLFFVSCTTNPITKYNFDKDQQPGSPKLITYAIPGLPQLLMGEYLEALIYFSMFAATAYNYIVPPSSIESSYLPDFKNEMLAGVGLAYLIGSWDGIVSDSDRQDTWKKYNSFGMISDSQMVKIKQDDVVEMMKDKIDYQVVDVYNDGIVNFEYLAINKSTLGIMMGNGNLTLRVTSNYSMPLTIKWEKSYFKYSNGSDPIFYGVYSMVSNTPNMPSQPIMPNEILNINLFGVSQIVGQVDYVKFRSNSFELFVCIDKDGGERYYKIITNIK